MTVGGPSAGSGATARPVTVGVGADGHARLVQRRAAQDPFEGRAPDDEHREVLVAGLGLAEVRGRGHRVAAGGDEGIEHVGQVRAELGHDPSQEPVGLVGLRAPRRAEANASSGSASAGSGSRSSTVTRCPARPSRRAEVRPPTPPPTTTMCFCSHSDPRSTWQRLLPGNLGEVDRDRRRPGRNGPTRPGCSAPGAARAHRCSACRCPGSGSRRPGGGRRPGRGRPSSRPCPR